MKRRPARLIDRVWPRCPHCRQSCTGSYNHRPRCIRCTSSHRLALETPEQEWQRITQEWPRLTGTAAA